MKKQATIFFIILLVVGFMSTEALAGTTGKIAGKITDATTGEPLPGANVIIEGTPTGAATDLDGNYNIINIPPGLYNLRVKMMGYAETLMEGIRTRIDLTTTVSIKLQQTVLEAGETVTVVAERPLVQMDMTYSLSSVGADQIDDLPVQTINDVMELQAGVVESNGLHLRGGRTGEIAYWVDGISATDVFSGGIGVTVENSAVQELQVVSGTYNAEYGQAMSGIINIITKEGGRNYHGEIKGYVGDYVSTSDLYDVWKSVNYDSTAGQLVEDKENPIKKINPIYNGEFSLSGPVPFTADKLSFFANARYFANEGYLYGREWYKPQGIAGDSSLVPMNPNEQYSTQAKLTFKPMSSLKIGYNLFYNQYQRDRTFNRSYKYNPLGVPLQKGGGFTHILTLNHILSPRTFYELRLNNFYNEYESYVYEDPEARPHWLVRVLADSLNEEQVLDLDVADQVTLFDELKGADRQYQYFVDPSNSEGYVAPDSAYDPASYSFYRAGNNLNYYSRSTAYWVGKFDLTSQANNSHQLKFGAEVRVHELKLDDIQLQAKRKEGKDEYIVPFASYVPPTSTIYHDKYTRKPKEFSTYVQDKLEYQDVNFNVGLRFDWFDANSVVPADPTDPNIYTPFKYEHIYKDWVEPPPGTVGAALDAYEATFTAYTPDERRAFMHKKVDPKMKLSPRAAVAYPITDRGVIHGSYGHFFQIPEFQYLYDGPDFKLTSGGGRVIIGNADLNPQRTTQYEIGLQQQLTENMGVDMTLFYRDIRDWVGTSPIITTVRPGVGYSIYENKDYSNVRGITVKLEKRFSNNIAYYIDYSYQTAEGTYSNPNDAFNATQNNQEPRLNLIPLNWDQKHTLNARIMYRLKGWVASFIGRYWSGRPYTPSFALGTQVGAATFSGLTENSSRLPTVNSYDLRLEKELGLGTLRVSAFIYVYNLFDQKEERSVFSDTGSAEYTTYPRLTDVVYTAARIGSPEDLLMRPEWYIAPREVNIGFTVGF